MIDPISSSSSSSSFNGSAMPNEEMLEPSPPMAALVVSEVIEREPCSRCHEVVDTDAERSLASSTASLASSGESCLQSSKPNEQSQLLQVSSAGTANVPYSARTAHSPSLSAHIDGQVPLFMEPASTAPGKERFSKLSLSRKRRRVAAEASGLETGEFMKTSPSLVCVDGGSAEHFSQLAGASTWPCEVCTFVNEDSAWLACAMCRCER
jgi:hypothetical protein